MNRWAVALVGIWLGTVAAAPEGWVEQAGTNGATVYNSQTHPGTSVILLPARRATLEPKAFAQALVDGLAKGDLCPLGAQAAATPDGGAVAIAEGQDKHCVLRVVPAAGGTWRVGEAIAEGPGAMDIRSLATALLSFEGSRTAMKALPGPDTTRAVAPTAARIGQVPQPIGALFHGHVVFEGMPLTPTWTFTPWFLFPGGVATDCVKVDPAALTMTLAALRARKDCTGARWRRVGGKLELQEKDGEAWETKNLLEKAPKSRGFRTDFHGRRSGGAVYYNQFSGVKATIINNSGDFILTADGRISASVTDSFSIGDTGNSQSRVVEGRYVLNGYVLRITRDDGRVVQRYMVFNDEAKSDFRGAYYEDEVYLEKRSGR